MSQWHMIDTNTVSHIVRGNSAAARRKLASLAHPNIPCISVVTEAEIRYGLAKMLAAHNLNAAIEGFLSKIQVLPWRSEEAHVYGSLRAMLEAAGKTLGNLDMLIAAHAIAIEAVLVTADKAFSNVGDLLATANWATDL